MANIKLQQGKTLSNQQICDLYKCSTQGGMRRSHRTKTLILVSDYTRDLYEDRWDDNNIFHYTGMGQTGDQSLDYSQNKTLYESDVNGVEVHLFQVYKSREYIYQGIVNLAGEPYTERQLDKDKNERNVWVYPLNLIEVDVPAPISMDTLKEKQQRKEKAAKKLSLEELKNRARKPKPTSKRPAYSMQYTRDEHVKEYALHRANGRCELCEKSAPFKRKDGTPFLEVHHIQWISRGGPDTIENTVSLCPNCHKKMHILDIGSDKTKLESVAK